MSLPATPIAGETKPFSASTTNSVVELEVTSPQIIINSSGSNSVEVFYRTGETAAEAVAVVPSTKGDYPILPSTIQSFTKPDNHRFVGFITASGTASGWVSPTMGK